MTMAGAMMTAATVTTTAMIATMTTTANGAVTVTIVEASSLP